MGFFFVYVLKASLCLAVFYLFYRALLGKETFHRFNRLALLGLLAFSYLLPAVEVTMPEAPRMGQAFVSLEEVMVPVAEGENLADGLSAALPWKEAMVLVYVLGVVFFFARHLWSFARMIGLLRTSRKECLDDGITLFVHRRQIAPFSWMKLIAVSEADLADGREAILAHECAHIANRHSWDLLLAELCAIFQWFNPAAWLLKQELQTVHEYEADEWVIRHGIDAKAYQLLLIKKAVGAKLYYMANSLNQSSLKKRITMMMKKKSNPWARMKYVYVLPLAAVAVAAFARPEVSNRLGEISSVDASLLVQTLQDKTVKVSGQVLEADTKQPIPGVSVVLRGTKNDLMTDKDGKFTFPELAEGDVLQFSHIGLQTQTVVVKDEKPLTVLMKQDVQQIEELVVVGLAADGEGVPSGSNPEKKAIAVVDIPEEAPQEELIFTIVEDMPQFPGGKQELMKFLGKNITYPVSAQKAQIEGSVMVQFVVGKDGSVRNPKVVRSVNPELDAEALRLVGIMPKWTPGKQRGKAVPVSYNLPISFRLDKKKAASDEEAQAVEDFFKKNDGNAVEIVLKFPQDISKNVAYQSIDAMKFRTKTGKEPWVVVDGEELGFGTPLLSKISPDEIERIEVLRGSEAKARFGDKAKEGAILITKKKVNP